MTKQSFLKYMNFGWQLLAGMAIFTGGGWWVDARSGTQVWTGIGLCAGIAYCGYMIWILIVDANK